MGSCAVSACRCATAYGSRATIARSGDAEAIAPPLASTLTRCRDWCGHGTATAALVPLTKPAGLRIADEPIGSAHYHTFGWREGRDPNAFFDIGADGFDFVYYLATNPDVAAAGVDPLWHFRTIGWKEGRDPSALFDTSGYLATYTDVAAANINPFDHYNLVGWKEGRDPSVGFDTTSYLATYADVVAAHTNPLTHFLQFGQQEGRSAFPDGIWG